MRGATRGARSKDTTGSYSGALGSGNSASFVPSTKSILNKASSKASSKASGGSSGKASSSKSSVRIPYGTVGVSEVPVKRPSPSSVGGQTRPSSRTPQGNTSQPSATPASRPSTASTRPSAAAGSARPSARTSAELGQPSGRTSTELGQPSGRTSTELVVYNPSVGYLKTQQHGGLALFEDAPRPQGELASLLERGVKRPENPAWG